MEPEPATLEPERSTGLAAGLTVEEIEAVCAAALSDVIDLVEEHCASKEEWWSSSHARLAAIKAHPVPMTAEQREELARLTAYWRKVKWGAQQAMLSMANQRLANAGNYSMRVTNDVVRKLAAELLYVKLDAWIYYWSQRRAKAQRLRHARRVLQRSAMKVIARAWRGWSVEQWVHRSVLARAIARLSHKSLGRSFRGWVHHHVTQGRQAIAVETARRKILMTRVLGAYSAWAGLHRQARLRKFKIACSLRRIHRHLTRHAFHEWAHVAHTDASQRRATAESEAVRITAETEAARIAAQAAAKDEARAARIIAEVRARAQTRGLRTTLAALERNSYAAPRKRSKLDRGLKLHRNGVLQWAWAWMGHYATRRARSAERLNRAKVLMRHSTMRRYLYRFAATPARLRAEDEVQREKAAHNASLEASEAEAMRLGIDNRRLQRKMRIMEEGTNGTSATEGPGGDTEAGAEAAVPRLKIPGSPPRSARSRLDTPQSARTTRPASARSARSSRTGQSTPRTGEPAQQSQRASGLEAELSRLNQKVSRLAERESHILSMLTERCGEEDENGDARLLVTPRGNNLETKAAAAVSRGVQVAAAMEQQRTMPHSKQTGSDPSRHATAAMLPAGFAPWKGRDTHDHPRKNVAQAFYASSTHTQQLVRYPASFNELVPTPYTYIRWHRCIAVCIHILHQHRTEQVRVLHKTPKGVGVGLQVEEMAYSSLYIHTHVSTVASPETTSSEPRLTTATTHIYAEDVSRTRASLEVDGLPRAGKRSAQMETVAPPARSKTQRRRSRPAGRQRGSVLPTGAGNYEAAAAQQAAAATTKLSELHPQGLHKLAAAMARVKIAAA